MDGGRRLRDGTPVLLRPLQPEDRDRLREAYLELTPESQYARFLAPVPTLTPLMLHRLVDHVDGHMHVALLLCEQAGEEIGIGRFVREPQRPEYAEMAFTIAEDWRGRGAGAALCDGLVAQARKRGVRYFTATVLATNAASLRLLLRAGRVVRRTLAYAGTVEVEMELQEPPEPAPRLLERVP